MLRQRPDLFRSLTERRDVEGDHVDPIIEIFPEELIRDERLEVPVRRRDDPYIHGDWFAPADSPEREVLEHMEQLGLEGQREFADFVEEDRALVRDLEGAQLATERAGEGALLMSEQLRLEQLGGEGRAVHFDPWTVVSGGRRMQAAGDQLLADPSLPCEEHSRRRAGHRLDHLADGAQW
jgi:hypothetical protein